MVKKLYTNSPLLLLVLLLLAKAIISLALIVFSDIGLSPDEAQYWAWSKHLDWGYYSKPPGIAWEIWAGCQLFGNSELGVRFGAVVISSLIALAIYLLARCCGGGGRVGFWSGAAMALAPAGILASFAATTDGGFILFWILCCCATAAALRRAQAPNYFIVGCLIAMGALFKFTIYLFWPFILVATLFSQKYKSKLLPWGMGISLLGAIPSLIWNAQHDWATFRHLLFSNIIGSHGGEKLFFNGNFLEFLGAQVGILSPIYFALLLYSLVVLIHKRKEVALSWKFCGLLCFVFLGAYLAISSLKKMQANWAIFAYPSGIVLLAWAAVSQFRSGELWLRQGTYLSVILCAFAIAIVPIQSNGFFSKAPIPWALNLFKQEIGGKILAERLQQLHEEYPEDFLFSPTYQVTSLLKFYGSIPEDRAYFFNLDGRRKNQFSYWPGMGEREAGHNGIFVLLEHGKDVESLLATRTEEYQVKLLEYFQSVEVLPHASLFQWYGKPVKAAAFLRCISYKGTTPTDPEVY